MHTASLRKRMVGPLKGLSLHHRIPLLTCLLLFIVIGLFITISYFSIRKIEAGSARERLKSLTTQASSMFSESIDDMVKTTTEAASSLYLQQYFDSSATLNIPGVIEILNRYAGNHIHERTYLFNKQFDLLLSSNRNNLAADEDVRRYIPKVPDGSLKAGYIYKINDTVYYPVVAPVMIKGNVKGYVVRCRQVRVTSKVLDQFSALAGRGIALLVGNKDGSLFTDLSKPISYQLPPNAAKPGGIYEYGREEGFAKLGCYEFIAGTPWLVVMEAPRSLAFRGSVLFLKWMVAMGALLIMAGLFIAWHMARNLTLPLNDLIVSVTALGKGDKSTPVPVHRTDEVGALAQSFNTMLSRLQVANNETREQILASEQLNIELRRLSAHLSSVREEERVSIARELHDQLGQLLTAFKMDVHAVKRKLAADSNPLIMERLKAMEINLDEGVKFVRKLSSELRAGPLEDLGLLAALQWYGDSFAQRYNIPVRIHSNPSYIDLPLPIATALFRIFQECLTNVARHAKATEVNVSISSQDELLTMSIADNGKGFDSSQQPKTLGLLGMKERALIIGAQLNIKSSPGAGCTVELVLKEGKGEG